MAKKAAPTTTCNAAEARNRLAHAQLYLQVAKLVDPIDGDIEATVATGNAVLAGIAAGDALCCSLLGIRSRSADHMDAADLLETATGDRKLASVMRDLLGYKDAGHCGLDNVTAPNARAAIRRAGTLVAFAVRTVR